MVKQAIIMYSAFKEINQNKTVIKKLLNQNDTLCQDELNMQEMTNSRKLINQK